MKITLHPTASLDELARQWREVIPILEKMGRGEEVTLDLGEGETCGAGASSFLLQLRHLSEIRGLQLTIHDPNGLVAEVEKNFPLSDYHFGKNAEGMEQKSGWVIQLGEASVNLWRSLLQQLSFLGEVCYAAIQAVLHPRSFRYRDLSLCFERAGMDALPITLLIGFLLGLILAFMSASSLRQFGVEIFVADLIAIGLFRELGPIITAIILAGRSGSAFAAEIGTMKVNEELDALSTFGLSPVQFLALPRILAAAAVMPILSMFSIGAGLIGGCLVLMSMGVPPVTYWSHVISSTSLGSILFGLGKSVVFGLLVGLIGCNFWVQTGRTADAVGRSATASVVGSLVMITFFDGLFAVFSYLIGI